MDQRALPCSGATRLSETIFITGILGQDGAYLAEHALKAGHRVVGGVRKDSARNLWRLAELRVDQDVELVDLDLLDHARIRALIENISPSRVFNLAAQSFVVNSFEEPLTTIDAAGMGVLRLLEAIREVDRTVRFFQASTSEMFGRAVETPQRETTPFYPRSPYGGGQGVCAPHHEELPRGLRPARLLRHPVQPREPAARRGIS